jgi:TolB-like protein/TolA-binding protein
MVGRIVRQIFEAIRNQPRRVRVLVAGAIIAATALGAALTSVVMDPRPAPSHLAGEQKTSDGPLVLTIQPLENRTGDAQLDWLGDGLASLIQDELARSRFLQIAAPASAGRTPGDPEISGGIATVSAPIVQSYVLRGEFSRTSKGLVLTTSLTDSATGRDISTEQFACKTPEDLLSISALVARFVRRRLNIQGSEQVEAIAANFAAGHVAAYESYVAGLQAFLRFDYERARKNFEAALEEEPAYAMARYRLAHTQAALGDTTTALEEIDRAERDANILPDREQRYIRAAKPYFNRDYARAEFEYKSLLNAYPHEREARQLLVYILYDRDKYLEALENARALSDLEPDSEVVWGAIAELNLRLHRYDEASTAVHRFLQLSPRNPNAHYLSGETAYLRGRLDEARPRYEAALRFDPQFGSAHLRLAYADVLQGREQDALQRLEKVAGTETLSASDRISAVFEWAYLLRAKGQCERVQGLLNQFDDLIKQEGIQVSLALALRSHCERDAGNYGEARRLAEQAVGRAPGRPTRYLLARGMAEQADGDLAALEATIAVIDKLSEGTAVPGQTERKAARYLEGLQQMAMHEPARAVAAFRDAMRGTGYAYELYALGLAEALLAAGDRVAAQNAISDAVSAPAPDNPRLDLEASRRRARDLVQEMRQLH